MIRRTIKLAALSLVAVVALGACANTATLTGAAAQARFSYRGRPIQPFCVDFSLEESSRHVPIPFAECTDTAARIKVDSAGWRRADFPHLADSPPPSGGIGYRVLAARADSVLIATEQYGRGSGYFTYLLWARVDRRKVTAATDVLGGDRCGGELSNYVLTPPTLRVDIDLSTRRIVALANPGVPRSTLGQLRNSYTSCDGIGTYEYDLASGALHLMSVTLHPDLPLYEVVNDTSRRSHPQACYVSLAKEYVATGHEVLSPAALENFGVSFAKRCGDSSGRGGTRPRAPD
jgi:hypothetical protein